MSDIVTYADVLEFAKNTGYFVMLPLMIVEGPIITLTAAFAASLGLFNIYAVFALSLLGNILGDAGYFFIGRIARHTLVDQYLKKFKIRSSMIEKIEAHLKTHPGKALTLIKLVPPLPTPGLLLAGASKMSPRTFFIYSTLISAGFSLTATLLGYYSGLAVNNLDSYSGYFEIILLLVLLVSIGGYFAIKKLRKSIGREATWTFGSILGEEERYLLASVALLTIGLLGMVRNILAEEYNSLIWFCDLAPFLFVWALYLKNHQFIKGITNIALSFQLISLVLLTLAVFFKMEVFGFSDILNYGPFYILITFILHTTAFIALLLTAKVRPEASALLYSMGILVLVMLATFALTPPKLNINYIQNITGLELPFHTELFLLYSLLIIVLPTHLAQYGLYHLLKSKNHTKMGI